MAAEVIPKQSVVDPAGARPDRAGASGRRRSRASHAADVPAEHLVDVIRTKDGIEVEASSYQLAVPDLARPRVVVRDLEGRELTVLMLLAGAGDVSWSPRLEIDDRGVSCHWQSSVWESKEVRLTWEVDRIVLSTTVTGTAVLPDVTLLGGDAVLPTGAAGTFRSAIGHRVLFSPNPSEPVAALRPAGFPATSGVTGDAEAGRLNAVFCPAPFAWGLASGIDPGATLLPRAEWLGLWLDLTIDEATFTSVSYEPRDGGFLLRLAYEGCTTVEGSWTSPRLVVRPGCSDPLEIVRLESGPLPARRVPAWHLQPLFCGWGAQCARARTVNAEVSDLVGEVTVVAGPALARQELYDEWLGKLDRAGLNPGTVVIDDRWQASYGLHDVDTEKWPDLRGWVARQHALKRKVVLWWKAWDPEGLPPDECVRLPDGTPVACDPTSPAYRDRLARTVAHLLGPDGIDADGFKVDFTQRCPSGPALRRHDPGGPWGVALLHLLLKELYEAAHEAKPDALVATHAAHHLFADVADMVRLNDVTSYGLDGIAVPVDDQLRFRAAIAGAALPGMPIDTDQWPMPNRAAWQSYVRAQHTIGVPALYYVDSIDRSGEELTANDLALVRETWDAYRRTLDRTTVVL